MKELVDEKYKNNIIDNKQLITNKIFDKRPNFEIVLVDFLEKSPTYPRYPPFFVELIVCIATNHPNKLISKYMEDKFFSTNLQIDEQQLEKSIYYLI